MKGSSNRNIIIEKTFRALGALETEFREEPTLFFTEHDLISRAYSLVQEGLGYPWVEGIDGNHFYLVHQEYPTPFRCDMKGRYFSVKGEEDRTPRGGRYQRGHYDLVVFNPGFLKKCNYLLAKGQNYKVLRKEMPGIIKDLGEAPILVGIEFMFNRKSFSSVKDAGRWWEAVLQDYEKLAASRQWEGFPFMEETLMMAFDLTGDRPVPGAAADLVNSGMIRHCVPGEGYFRKLHISP